MSTKTDKELAVEAAIEFTNSWNSTDSTVPLTTDEFNQLIKDLFSTISSL